MHHYQQMIKNILRLFIPKFILNFRINKVEKKRHFLYKNLSMGDIFSNIYSNKEWGKGNDEFFSGSGTHNVNISKPYIEAVKKIIESSTGKQVLVDIGSGDFSIGRNFIHIVDYYYACDVVFDLQNYNRKKFFR